METGIEKDLLQFQLQEVNTKDKMKRRTPLNVVIIPLNSFNVKENELWI